MKLQDIVKNTARYDLKAVAADDELSRQIQSRLIDLGLLRPPVDGILGPLSTAALRQFQEVMQCEESGFVGPVTAKKLIETTRAIFSGTTKLLAIVKNNTRLNLSSVTAATELGQQIQSRLIDLGLLKPPADGIFGPISTAALRQFQEITQCNEPGIVGPVTARKLLETKKEQLPSTMKLQDIIKNNTRYDVKAIAADDELSRQIQSRLIDLGLLKPPVDGIFGPLSTAALHRFQTLLQCGEPGFLGPVTAKKLIETKAGEIPFPPPILKIVQDTVFKAKPLASSQLIDSEKVSVPAGKEYELLAFAPIRGHVRVAFRSDSFNGSGVWYVFDKHVQITQEGTLLYPKPNPPTVRLNVPYLSQMDNWYNPTGSCNVTSMAMCLQYFGAARRTKSGQFEDELYQYALTKGYSRWSPYDLAKIVRDYGCQDYFTEAAMIEDVQDWLASGNPAVIHGYFTSFGHIIVVVGYDEDGFFVHDPYGEWFENGYRNDLSGAYLHYSYRVIRRICIPDGNFWVHFISK